VTVETTVNLLLHFAFFFSAHRLLAANDIFRFAAADTVRFFGLPEIVPPENPNCSVHRI
jgi:hypothetical protein